MFSFSIQLCYDIKPAFSNCTSPLPFMVFPASELEDREKEDWRQTLRNANMYGTGGGTVFLKQFGMNYYDIELCLWYLRLKAVVC